jgi:hypothetical protein
MIIVPCGQTAGAKAWCLPYIHIPSPRSSAFHGWKILGFVMMAEIWHLRATRALASKKRKWRSVYRDDGYIMNKIKYRHEVLSLHSKLYIAFFNLYPESNFSKFNQIYYKNMSSVSFSKIFIKYVRIDSAFV